MLFRSLPWISRTVLTSCPVASLAGSPAPSTSPPQNAVEPPQPVHLATVRDRATASPNHPAPPPRHHLHPSRALGEPTATPARCLRRVPVVGVERREKGREALIGRSTAPVEAPFRPCARAAAGCFRASGPPGAGIWPVKA